MWVNILIKESIRRYMVLTDEEIGIDDTYVLNSLIDDGWEEFCNLHRNCQSANNFMRQFYPEYTQLKYTASPITIKEAKQFVNKYHRHHIAPQGGKFAVSISDGDMILGVAIAGRPVSRFRDDGKTIEVTRLCVKDGYKNTCSLLYSKVSKIAKEMGYEKVITYTLDSENGKSLLAAGFSLAGVNKGGSWHSKSRPREDNHPTGSKKIWELSLTG